MKGNLMNIKILVATHKQYWMPEYSVYVPIQVGAAGNEDIGYMRDNSGDNISHKNKNFCELTGLYWAWKNLDADYMGLVHYRRYFTRQEKWGSNNKKKQILMDQEWERLLLQYPVVVADKRKYYIETNRSHYNHAHPREGLDIAERIIQERYPVYHNTFSRVMSRTWAHMFNMFVMRRDYADLYCQWLFDILFDVETRLDISQYDKYQSRVYGFIAERLLDVWLETNHISYKEQNVSFLESQNWLKKGGNFLKRKFL